MLRSEHLWAIVVVPSLPVIVPGAYALLPKVSDIGDLV